MEVSMGQKNNKNNPKTQNSIEHSYEVILKTIELLSEIPELEGKIRVSGGLVPWLLTNTDSGRKHGDIDIVVDLKDMSTIRDAIKKYNAYVKADSFDYIEGNGEDYGIDIVIGGVDIGFYPYTINKAGLKQNSFSPLIIDGKHDLKTLEIPGLTEYDIMAEATLPNGKTIKVTSPELVMATKKLAGREKDVMDLEQLKECGIDWGKLTKIERCMQNMKSTLQDRKNVKQFREKSMQEDIKR